MKDEGFEKAAWQDRVRYLVDLGLSWQELTEVLFPDLYGQTADRTMRSDDS
jgi:hypothetical protein